MEYHGKNCTTYNDKLGNLDDEIDEHHYVLRVVEKPSAEGPSPFERTLEKSICEACKSTEWLRIHRVHLALKREAEENLK